MDQSMPTPEFRGNIVDADDGYAGQSIENIIRREEAHHYASERLCCIQALEDLPQGKSDDSYLFRYMPILLRLHKRIMSSDSPPAVTMKYKRFTNHEYKDPTYTLTTVGKEVLLACKIFASQVEGGWNWKMACDRRKFHPIINVMLRAVTCWYDAICAWQDQHLLVIQFEEDQAALDALHRFVNHVRRECQSKTFKKALKRLERTARDNFRSGRNMIIDMFGRHSCVLTLRIDLTIPPEAKAFGYSDELYDALDKYLRDLRRGTIVPGFLKLIIKEEDAILRGRHFHLMVFLDGHLHRNACYMTKLLGEAWRKRIGPDRSSYFNCYKRTDSYLYNGLGLVRVGDVEKLAGLRIALWYMTKRDTILEVDEAHGKAFWRSPKYGKNVSQLGAPRKNGDGMAVVKRMLGGRRNKYPEGWSHARRQFLNSELATGRNKEQTNDLLYAHPC